MNNRIAASSSNLLTLLTSPNEASQNLKKREAALFGKIMHNIEHLMTEDEQLTSSLRNFSSSGQLKDLKNVMFHTLQGTQQDSIASEQAQAVSEEKEDVEIEVAFLSLWEKIYPLLQEGEWQQPDVKTTLYRLLEQWTAMEKQAGEKVLPPDVARSADERNGKEQEIWTQLLHAFRSRSLMNNGQRYGVDAAVSSRDIGNWFKQALSRYKGEDMPPAAVKTSSFYNMSVSQLEQFDIYLHQSGKTEEALEKQLLSQFRQAIKTSGFFTKNSGESQLLLKIRPVHLGEVVIQLTKLDGELTVKLTVATQAAKEMLEGNAQQLKHLFAPHQVVIEKQTSLLEQETYQYDDGQSKDKQEQTNEEDKEQDVDTASQEEADAALTFSQLLLNEKA